MTGILLVATLVLGIATSFGGWYIYKLHKDNRELCEKVGKIESEIAAQVEERLVSHTKYCEQLDARVQEMLGREEAKWRELLEKSTCQVKEAVKTGLKQAASKVDADMAEVMAKLEKQKMNFKGLLDQAYLEQYEKMRRNPPRPKKGPRKKIDPPQRYRSLDDDFSFFPPTNESN